MTGLTAGYQLNMSEKPNNPPHDELDVRDAVIAADDTGLVQNEVRIVEVEIAEAEVNPQPEQRR